MDHEFNEQRIRDVEIPLHHLEERVTHIESQIQSLSIDNISRTVCNKINKDMRASVPSIWMELEKLKEQQVVEDDDASTDMKQDLKDVNFTVNVLRNDLKVLKQYIRTQGIDDISKLTSQTSVLSMQIDILKENMSRTVKIDDLDELNKKTEKFVKLEEFKFLENECNRMIKIEHIEELT